MVLGRLLDEATQCQTFRFYRFQDIVRLLLEQRHAQGRPRLIPLDSPNCLDESVNYYRTQYATR